MAKERAPLCPFQISVEREKIEIYLLIRFQLILFLYEVVVFLPFSLEARSGAERRVAKVGNGRWKMEFGIWNLEYFFFFIFIL